VRFWQAELFVTVLLTAAAVAVWWPSRDAEAAFGWKFAIMSSDHSDGSVTEYGLHFDDGSLGAYDYSHYDEAWLRGSVTSSMAYLGRYMYWAQGSCRVRGRFQWYDPYNNV
jgi:hypothetical protein